MALPAALLDEILEEILFRIPPDDPARLVHVALVCRAWCRLVADGGFQHRYREFHRTASMLGFFHNPSRRAGFVPTSSFRKRDAYLPNRIVMDIRHGRVLLHRPVTMRAFPDPEQMDFVIWDPITNKRTEPPRLKGHSLDEFVWSAAVLCAASKSGTCDHLGCHGGPTLVIVMVRALNSGQISVRIFSSEDGSWAWSKPKPVLVVERSLINAMVSSALGGKLLYFAFSFKTIVKYNLDTQEASDMHRPPHCFGRVALMTTQDGRLQLANVNDFRLYLWSREDGHEGDAGWAQNRVIDLKKLIPARALETSPFVVGAANGSAVVFLQTLDGLFTFDLKSEQATKVHDGDFSDGILPYMSFCTPALDRSLKMRVRVGAL